MDCDGLQNELETRIRCRALLDCMRVVGGRLFCNNWIYIYTFRKKTSRHTENCISFHVEVYSNSYYYMSEIPNKKMQFWHNAAVENQKDYCIFVLVSNENSYVPFVQAILNNQSALITLRLMNCVLCTRRILSALNGI